MTTIAVETIIHAPVDAPWRTCTKPTHSIEPQQAGWQAILDNVARHVEGR